MNPETTASSPVALNCQHRSATSRRFCRLPVTDAASGPCFRHAAEQKKLDSINLAATLIGDTSEFTSAVTINRSLGELYKLLARNEIVPRRAAVMAYTASLLLRTLPAIQKETHHEPQNEFVDIDGAIYHSPEYRT